MTSQTTTPTDFQRRMSKKIDEGREIQIKREELDIFVVSGAWKAVCDFAEQFQRDQCLARNARNRSIPGGNLSSINDPVEKTSKSDGTNQALDANEAAQRAEEIFGKPSRNSTGSILKKKPGNRSAPLAGGRGKRTGNSS